MFHHLEGTVSEIAPDFAVIDCFGIGFSAMITPNTAAGLKTGQKAKLFISEAIGEDHFDLYGFSTYNEKKFFELLTTVSGVGPKAAMSILSYNSPDSITAAVAQENEKAFTMCQGIGKKTAQRIILELKDKLAKGFTSDVAILDIPGTAGSGTEYDNAVTALTTLGYSTPEIIRILKQINTENMSTQDIIKSVLKYMV